MKYVGVILTIIVVAASAAAQERKAPNTPGERTQPQPARTEQQAGEIEVQADRAIQDGDIATYDGYVEVRTATLRLQADRVVLNWKTFEGEATGNVIFDADGQRITGNRARYNHRTQKGTIWNATGFTDRTPDGTTLYFEAERVEKVDFDTYVIYHGRITACEETRPLWSLTTRRMQLQVNRRVSLGLPAFRVKDVPLLVLPYATLPISKKDRSSGFLIPGFSKSNVKGISLSIPYYQTLGRSADITPRLNIYTARGIGYGADLRTRSSENSYLNTGFFVVQDRLFGPEGADQGGTAFYAKAVQFFPKGFVGTADVNITSSFAFRQVFSDSFQQAISPEEKIQIYLSNNFSGFSFNALFLSRSIFLPGSSLPASEPAETTPPVIEPGPGTLLTFRRLPSFSMSGRPLRLIDRAPLYLSFDAAIEGVARKEPTFKTPSVVQRLDGNPRLTLPIFSFNGLSVTPDISLRTTFYSESADPRDRTRILGESLTRNYFDFSVDIRPPAFERVFHHRDGSRWFQHLIEPSVVYRRIKGIGADFARVIRVDESDAIADTNEVEYSLINRFFTTRRDQLGQSFPHELLSVRISQKYFFDPTFGGALKPGQRNQFFPINTLSGFSFGGEPRRFSPVNVSARVQPLSSLLADVRFDYDTKQKTMRAFSVTVGMRKTMLSVLQTWYYTHRVSLDAGRFEAGTFSGNLWQSSFTIGNQGRGLFVGADLLYDFTDRVIGGMLSSRRLASSTIRIGYSFNCCSLLIQNTTFKVGLRSENRLAFALVLNGIGSFGSTSAGRRFLEPYAPQ